MAIIRTISFPFQVGELSFPKEATDDDAILASVVQILTTGRGERIMRPDFGCDAFSFLFETQSEEFRLMVEREVRTALVTWEPRIEVNSVSVSTDDVVEPGQTLVFVEYTIIQSNKAGSVSVVG